MAAAARVIWLRACVRYWPERGAGVGVCPLLLSFIDIIASLQGVYCIITMQE